MASSSARLVRRAVPALVGASASGLFMNADSEGPVQLVTPGSSISDLRNMMLTMPVDNSLKETILDLGIDMASDPRIQLIVAEKYGVVPSLKLQQVDLTDELEEQRELNKQLLLHNDRLMNEIDNLKKELRQSVPPVSAAEEPAQPQTAQQQQQQQQQRQQQAAPSAPRNPLDNYTFTVDNDKTEVHQEASSQPDLSGLWVFVIGVATLVALIFLRR